MIASQDIGRQVLTYGERGKFDGFKDADTNVSPALSRRDMATQMNLEGRPKFSWYHTPGYQGCFQYDPRLSNSWWAWRIIEGVCVRGNWVTEL
ncbi:hypothetical protein glysoja_039961 [Glycine soja]|uniref:Uncharacterized protein n=1 Tax=Glycine soja TaxID=3848 RepID=A0A0B2S7L1_GLYSO|nr:hypothetical protein glysoja_039961 [Glycine soja]